MALAIKSYILEILMRSSYPFQLRFTDLVEPVGSIYCSFFLHAVLWYLSLIQGLSIFWCKKQLLVRVLFILCNHHLKKLNWPIFSPLQ